MKQRIGFWSIFAFILILLVGLGLLAYMGFYNRYWAEDYCYNRDFNDLGVIKSVGTYFSQGEDAKRGYSTNRYSLTLVSGLFYLAGMFGTQIQASVIILLWLGSLYWLLVNLLGSRVPKSIIFLGSSFLLYFTLILSPHRFQVLYWQAGVHYSYSLLLGCFILGLIFVKKNSKIQASVVNGLSALSGFIAGGLSETACAYLLTAIAMLLVVIWIEKKKNRAWAIQAFPTALMAFAGVFASLIALALSPSNTRYADMPANHPPVISSLPLLGIRYATFFITDSLRSLPAPHLVFICLFLSLPFLSKAIHRENIAVSLKNSIFLIFIALLTTFILIVVVQAPTAYYYSSQPAPRTQSLARFTMLVGLAIIAWTSGKVIANRFNKGFFFWIAFGVIVLSSIYTIRQITVNYQELPGFVHRANIWDIRDEKIKKEKSMGITRIEVPVIDTYLIDVPDIIRSKHMDKWTKNCGTAYYGIEAIFAIPP